MAGSEMTCRTCDKPCEQEYCSTVCQGIDRFPAPRDDMETMTKGGIMRNLNCSYTSTEPFDDPTFLYSVDTLLVMLSNLVERRQRYPVGYGRVRETIDQQIAQIEETLHVRGVHVTFDEIKFEDNWSQY